MKFVVTGGAGFIGAYLAESLLSKGNQVVIFDKQINPKFCNISVQGDLCDPNAAALGVLQDTNCVFHLAAVHHDNVKPISLYNDVNVEGSRNLILAMEKYNIKKAVFVSSMAVYGLGARQTEETSVCVPNHPYGITKLEAEKLFLEWVVRSPDRCLTIFRPASIFGAGSHGNLNELVTSLRSGKFMMVGSGQNKKSIGYVENLAEALSWSLKFTASARIINFADKPDFSMRQLVNFICAEIGSCPPMKVPYWVAYAISMQFDFLGRILGKKFKINSLRVKKFCEETILVTDQLTQLGFNPPFSIEEGLRQTIQNSN